MLNLQGIAQHGSHGNKLCSCLAQGASTDDTFKTPLPIRQPTVTISCRCLAVTACAISGKAITASVVRCQRMPTQAISSCLPYLQHADLSCSFLLLLSWSTWAVRYPCKMQAKGLRLRQSLGAIAKLRASGLF